MSNPVIDRIQNQITQKAPQPLLIAAEQITISPPVAESVLYELFLKEFLEESLPVQVTPQEAGFGNIFDFVAWYVEHQDQFSPEQRVALNTLVQTRDMVFQGCNCKQPQREYAAREYFKTFWTNNANTDMMPTLLKALGVQRVTFEKFLAYPA